MTDCYKKQIVTSLLVFCRGAKASISRISLLPKVVTAFYCILFFLFSASCVREKRIKVDNTNAAEPVLADTTAGRPLQIGVAAMLSPEYALPAYGELVDYIGRKLGKPTKMLFTKDYASMNEMIKSRKVIAAFVCSGPYVEGHDEWGMELIAAPSLYGSTSYYSYIIVNVSCQLKRFEDLEGRKFAFTDPQSNTGKLVPTYELSLRHKTPETFFSDFIYTGSHDKSIEAVAEGMVDGAAVDNLIWEYMNKTNPLYTSKTKVIAKLGPFCIPPFVTYPGLDPAVKKKLRSILLEMHNDPEGEKILNKLFIDRFVIVDDNCYKSIREMDKWLKRENKKGN
jgi:phosphonate transport system substrate-binding protein